MGHHQDEAEEEQVPFRLEGASGAGGHIVVTAAKRRWLASRPAARTVAFPQITSPGSAGR